MWEELFQAPGIDLTELLAKSCVGRVVLPTLIPALQACARRRGAKGQPLTQHQCCWLWLADGTPGSSSSMRTTFVLPSYWAELAAIIVIWDVIGREAPDEYKANTDADPHWEWAKAPEVRDAVRPVIAELARAASFLASEGIALDAAALQAVHERRVGPDDCECLAVLEKRANGDSHA